MRNCETITISVLPKFKKKLDDQAKKLNVSRSTLIRKAILDLIKTSPKKSDFTREF